MDLNYSYILLRRDAGILLIKAIYPRLPNQYPEEYIHLPEPPLDSKFKEPMFHTILYSQLGMRRYPYASVSKRKYKIS